MKYHHIKVLLLLSLFISIKSFSQQEKINENWIELDSIFIARYTNIIKSNPLQIDKILSPQEIDRSDLGFGYTFIPGVVGSGYVNTFYQLVYYDNQLIAFKFSPKMPSDSRLTKRYKKFYTSLFDFGVYKEPAPFHYNFAEMAKPLEGFSKTPSSKDLDYLMTPFSGIEYGDIGYEGGTTLANRAAFNEVKTRLTTSGIEMLLYSINPATRLTAAEYYYSNQEKFGNKKSAIEKRIKEIYIELPEVETMRGCLGGKENGKLLVEEFVKEGLSKVK